MQTLRQANQSWGNKSVTAIQNNGKKTSFQEVKKAILRLPTTTPRKGSVQCWAMLVSLTALPQHQHLRPLALAVPTSHLINSVPLGVTVITPQSLRHLMSKCSTRFNTDHKSLLLVSLVDRKMNFCVPEYQKKMITTFSVPGFMLNPFIWSTLKSKYL